MKREHVIPGIVVYDKHFKSYAKVLRLTERIVWVKFGEAQYSADKWATRYEYLRPLTARERGE